jgi:hypothetical protein
LKILDGWHKSENGGWRWTEKVFAVAAGIQANQVRMIFYLPDAQLVAGPVEIRCFADGVDLGSERYEEAGEHCFERTTVGGREMRLRFEVSHRFVDATDGRELGVSVPSVQFG